MAKVEGSNPFIRFIRFIRFRIRPRFHVRQRPLDQAPEVDGELLGGDFGHHSLYKRCLTLLLSNQPTRPSRKPMRYDDKHVRPALYAGLFGVVLGSIGAAVTHVSILIGAIAGFVIIAALVLVEPSDGGPHR
jgi:hypothetical protein